MTAVLGILGGSTAEPSSRSGRMTGSRDSMEPSNTSAASPSRSSATTPRLWSPRTIVSPARWSGIQASRLSAGPGLTPKACRPRRARTKGKIERGVGYVKHNALAGRSFTSFEELERHLARWMVEVADERIHGTTKEQPAVRFERDERRPCAPADSPSSRPQPPSWRQCRLLCRHDTIRYSAP